MATIPNDTINANGLQLEGLADIVADLVAAYQTIYGADINVDADSPDGQQINIFAQACADIRETLLDLYNSFSVELAYGVQLDQRVALNGVARLPGSYTLTPVLVTVGQAVTLQGLDQDALPVFTLEDDAGNEWQLEETHAFADAGSASLTFRAAVIGASEVVANTITNQSTTVLGVTSVNNPTTTGTIRGVNEETDPQLKVRRAKMFKLAAVGPTDAVAAALLGLPDVTDAYVVENRTGAEVEGTPAHSIWCIVSGGSEADIAQAIYTKKDPGCGMRGEVSYSIPRDYGPNFVAKWDVAVPQRLWARFALVAKIAGASYDSDSVKSQVAAALTYKLGQQPTISEIYAALATITPGFNVTSAGFSSDGGSYEQIVAVDSPENYFSLAAADVGII